MMAKKVILAIPGWSMDASIFNAFDDDGLEWIGVNLSDCQTSADYTRIVKESFMKCDMPISAVVGWSQGAMLALELAAEQAEQAQQAQIEALVLLSGTAKFVADSDYPHGINMDIIERMKRRLRLNPDETIRAFDQAMFSQTESNSQKKWMRTSMAPELALQSGLDYLTFKDLRPLLSKVRSRVLLIHGEKDSICPASASEYLCQHLVHAADISQHIYQGAGHHLLFTRRDEILQTIKEFLHDGAFQ